MFRKIAIVVLVLAAAILGYAATRPDTFRVQRMTSIKAPPEKIFPLIDDFHNFNTWSPYEKVDPAMKRAFSGPAGGKGAVYEFDGNMKVGKGRLEITDSAPPSSVTIRLDMLEPMESSNIVELTLEPQGESTNVTWAMHGPMPYLSKLICLFVNMDSMIGSQFEAGLADLKTIAEK